MKPYEATEAAYKNGYKKGYADALAYARRELNVIHECVTETLGMVKELRNTASRAADNNVGDKVSSTDKPRFLLKGNGDIVPLTNCQQWISVKDRLPEHEDIVLICTKDKDVQAFQWDSVYNGWLGDRYNYSTKYVTHWMPLPELPEGE